MEHNTSLDTLPHLMERINLEENIIEMKNEDINRTVLEAVVEVVNDTESKINVAIDSLEEDIINNELNGIVSNLESSSSSTPVLASTHHIDTNPQPITLDSEVSGLLQDAVVLEKRLHEAIQTISDMEAVTQSTKATPIEKILYLMRGVPGSGKSTLAKQILAVEHALSNFNGTILSTDDFFDKDGKYIFDPKELGNAHQWNQKRASDHISKGHSPIIIDNTNTCKWEAKYYVENALDAGYTVIIREPETVWWRTKDATQMAEKNSHGVPLDAIKRMIERFEWDFTPETILASEAPSFKKSPGSNGRGRGKPGRGK